MKRLVSIGVIMVMLSAGNWIRGEDCGIVNPSFESDGAINDLRTKDPNGWVTTIPEGKFTGYVYTNWSTDGFYGLTFSTKRAQYYADDMALVSLAEPVDLALVERITFDLKLETHSVLFPWESSICSAVLLVDDEVVWDSAEVGADAVGEYLDQVYMVEDRFRTAGPHILSLGLKINTDVFLWNAGNYTTRWDMVDCNLACGGAGPIEGDIDGDCCVDVNDLKLLAGLWLDPVDPNAKANLERADDGPSYGVVNLFDLAVYAAGWNGSFAGLAELGADGTWLEAVSLDDPSNLFGADDVLGGKINFYDFCVLAEAWLDCAAEEGGP